MKPRQCRRCWRQNGYEIVPFAEGADVYVINTCTVTNMADRKSRQMLHRARKMNPNAVVVAAGCYVQAQGAKADDCIDIIIGNNKKKDLIAILDEHFAKIEEKEPQVELIDIAIIRMSMRNYRVCLRQAEHTRAQCQGAGPAATSSALSVLSRMPEGGCAAVEMAARACG